MEKNAKNAAFFYKECKRMQRTPRSFIKNAKERKNVAFFWKEHLPNPGRFERQGWIQTFLPNKYGTILSFFRCQNFYVYDNDIFHWGPEGLNIKIKSKKVSFLRRENEDNYWRRSKKALSLCTKFVHLFTYCTLVCRGIRIRISF